MDNNYKNEMETLTKNYKHKICFRQKRKGNIYISCACTNARLPSLAEECRGWSLLEIQTAREVCDARGLVHRQKEPLCYYPKWTLHCTVCFALCGDFAAFKVVYQLGPKKRFTISGIMLLSNFAISDIFVTQGRIFTWTQNFAAM